MYIYIEYIYIYILFVYYLHYMYLIYTCTYAIDEHMFFPVFFSISFQTPLFPTNSSHLRWMLTIHGDQNTGYFAVLPDMFFPSNG